MSATIDSVVSFILLWGIPIALVTREYLKMGEDERKSARDDFKSKRFIFTIGFIVIGAFLSHVGMLFEVFIVKGMGIALFALGGILSSKSMWKMSKAKSVIMVLITAVVISVGLI